MARGQARLAMVTMLVEAVQDPPARAGRDLLVSQVRVLLGNLARAEIVIMDMVTMTMGMGLLLEIRIRGLNRL